MHLPPPLTILRSPGYAKVHKNKHSRFSKGGQQIDFTGLGSYVDILSHALFGPLKVIFAGCTQATVSASCDGLSHVMPRSASGAVPFHFAPIEFGVVGQSDPPWTS